MRAQGITTVVHVDAGQTHRLSKAIESAVGAGPLNGRSDGEAPSLVNCEPDQVAARNKPHESLAVWAIA